MKYTWNLQNLYSGLKTWDLEYNKYNRLVSLFLNKSEIGHTETDILALLRLEKKVDALYEKLSLYLDLKMEELIHQKGVYESSYSERLQELDNLYGQSIVGVTFLEAMVKDYNKLNKRNLILRKKFKPFVSRLEDIALSGKSGKLELMGGKINALADRIPTIYSNIINKMVTFPSITMNERQKKVVSGDINKLSKDPNRNIRKRVYYAKRKGLSSTKFVFTQSLNSFIQIKNLTARSNKSQLVDFMLSDCEMDRSDTDSIFQTAKKNKDIIDKYIAYKKWFLGYSDYRIYDDYINSAEVNTTIQSTISNFNELLDFFPKSCKKSFDKILRDRHYYIINKSKVNINYSGYCTVKGTTQPYIFLTFNKDSKGQMTFDHETGHALHNILVSKKESTQPSSLVQMETVAFIFEISSLFLRIKNERSKQKRNRLRMILADYCYDNLYKQSIDSEFELFLYETVQNGQILKSQELSDKYLSLFKTYFSKIYNKDVTNSDRWIGDEFFFEEFYYLKYLYAFAIALTISEKLISGNKDIQKKVSQLLELTGDNTIEDMTSLFFTDTTPKKIIQEAFNNLNEILNSLE